MNYQSAVHHYRRRKFLALYLLNNKQQNSKRQMWVRDIYSADFRKNSGAHDNLIAEMRLSDPERHFNYLRMSSQQFDDLLSLVGPRIAKFHTVREQISASTRLALTLRYLASGNSMVSISYAFCVGKSTVSEIIRETCSVLWDTLKDLVLAEPKEEYWVLIADNFNKKWNFPNCIGAINGKHVTMQAIPDSGSTFYNYKGSHSLILMAIADADYCFTAVDIGGEGRSSDGSIFRLSNIGTRLEENSFNIPNEREISNLRPPVPFVLVADEAFPLTTYMMRPYARGALTPQTRVFNYRLSRARRVIENAFGIMASRWRIFRKPIIAKVDSIERIIQACVCLHNWLKRQDDILSSNYKKYSVNLPNDEDVCSGLQDLQRTGTNMYSRNAAAVRNNLMVFFNEEGAVEWQRDKIINNEF